MNGKARLCVLCLVLLLALPLASCSQKQTVMVPMADGVKLATDVWLPKGDGPWPVAFARTPYNKDNVKGEGFNQIGVALVVQDVRGRFASEGEARPFFPDGWGAHQDGLDAAKWIVAQPWCSGKIATFGGSAVGITQYLLAGTGPPGLVACYPVVPCASLYDGAFFQGGVFRKSMIEGWYKLAQWPDYAMEEPLQHPRYDDLWKTLDLTTRASSVKVPMMHVGGWHDIFTQGTIDAFVALQERGGEGARGSQHLIMGPWAHGIKQTKIGQLQYPDNAKWPEGAPDELKWLTTFLLGDPAEADRLPAVWYYVMGAAGEEGAPGNEWRTAAAWPPTATETKLYLAPEGKLTHEPPPAGELKCTYDPANPAPTVGGRNLVLPAGPFDQREVESRPDVLVFSTDVLDAPVEVTGRLTVRLFASSTAKDTDFTGKITDVYPDGRSMLVADGILRARFRQGFDRDVLMQPGKTYEFAIDLQSTSLIFNRGHRIRVAISSSNAPRFDPNPNTGDPWRANDNKLPAEQTIRLGGKQASYIVLPVVGG
ncbi:MAG: CocE/NonD family hydrolase [Armatimonadetes bacterium]|nr:CocE/NonD family hydrolase [Armatimonadota bacterium]